MTAWQRKIGVTAGLLLVTAVFVAGGISVLKLAEADHDQEIRATSVDRGVLVQVVEATVREASFEVSAWGFLKPFEERRVSAEVPGYVASQAVEVSDRVTEGSVLFQLDGALRQAAMSKAEAALDRARSEHRLARENYKRVALLEAKDSANPTEVLQVTTNLEVADAAVRQAEETVEEARILLDKTTIRSPLAGQVARIHTRQGEYAHVGQPLVDLIETDRLKLAIQLGAREVIAFAPGDPVTMLVSAIPALRFEGRILWISPSARPDSRQFEVVIEVPNHDGRLRPGFFVQATLVPRSDGAHRFEEAASFVAIPRMAIFERYRQTYCYVIRHQAGQSVERAFRTRIETLPIPSDPEHVRVISGLEPGDRVVTTGLPHVTHEAVVRVGQPEPSRSRYTSGSESGSSASRRTSGSGSGSD
ncbi:MAG: efflux RND transporter periplasmic adaptor subunit [Planctomycetes bacterium]|nr:efflux RND transporter periplasmic adaptor subunit [Planctomycetota bacterium]